MSEHIVHTAILEDSIAICLGLSAMPEDFREVVRNHGRFAQLGCITVAGDQFSVRLLTEYREKWDGRDESLEARLAFVLGWISHRACDRTMKPIWVEPPMKVGSDVDPTLSPSECSVYHEGYMYNRYYRKDPKFCYAIFPEEMEKLPGMKFINRERAALYVQQSFGANYLAIQTLPEQRQDQEWFENLCMRAQKFYVDVNRYRKSAGDPDPDKEHGFLLDINWYNPEDVLVGLAEDLRWGRKTGTLTCDEAYAQEPSSYYGKALRLSIRYILAAAEFFHRKDMSPEELKERLDVGKPGPGGQGV